MRPPLPRSRSGDVTLKAPTGASAPGLAAPGLTAPGRSPPGLATPRLAVPSDGLVDVGSPRVVGPRLRPRAAQEGAAESVHLARDQVQHTVAVQVRVHERAGVPAELDEPQSRRPDIQQARARRFARL